MTTTKGDYTVAEWEGIPPSSDLETSNIFDLIRNVTNFASLLRVCGALIMLVAMSSYLMQGWSDGNDISRYYMLLSQTFLLAISGLSLSYLMKENKGARIFFGLGLISITVNMTTLGALIFSTTQWGSALVHYPSVAQWIAPEFSEIMMALLGTMLISAPVAWVGHKILARRSAHVLSGLFLFTNLLLLLPVRESFFVGLVALVAVILPVVIFCRRLSHDNSLRTPEGFFAMATVFVPAGIIICRSLWLYPVDNILQIILAGTAFIALRFCAEQTAEASFVRNITHFFSIFAAFGVAIPTAVLTAHYLPNALSFSAFGFVFSGLMWDLSTRCQKPHAFIRLAAIILAVSHIIPVIATENMSSAILCILAGLSIIAVARHHGMRYLIIMGALTFIAGTGRQILELAEWIDFSNWITLSISGGVIIIAASLIERHGAIIKMKWDRFGDYKKKEQM